MALNYVVYEIDHQQPNVIGIFGERSLVEDLLKRLRREFPHLSKEAFKSRFQLGYSFNLVADGKVNYDGKLYKLNPKEVKIRLRDTIIKLE